MLSHHWQEKECPMKWLLQWEDRPSYGKDYIIPSTFDPRLIGVIPVAVAKAAMKTGVARKKIENFETYSEQQNKD